MTRKFLALAVLIFSLIPAKAQDEKKVSTEDLQLLIGEWTGTLTYLDYNTNNPFTMKADLSIEKGKNEFQLILSNSYPKEPQANNKDKLTLSKEGDTLNKKEIISRKITENGGIEVMTEYSGKDGNEGKKATIRNSYQISNQEFIIQKEVQFEGSTEWIVRNIYKYQRK